jgi:hypothetical protein
MATLKIVAQVLIYPLGLLGIVAVSRLDYPLLTLGAVWAFMALALYASTWQERG